MKSITEKAVIQRAQDLKLIICNDKSGNLDFNAFHKLKVSKGSWELFIDIIGESHKIKICHSNSSDEINEILACISKKATPEKYYYENNLSTIKGDSLDLKFGAINYQFSFHQINFSDNNYEKTILDYFHKGEFRVSYDFKKKKKDTFENVYDPITSVNSSINSNIIELSSIHIYPNDELAIISESSAWHNIAGWNY